MSIVQPEVIFDADGVLIDTGPAHMRFLNDMNKKHGFDLPMMRPDDRAALRRISQPPMRKLMKNYGFPEEALDELDAEYARSFSTNERYAAGMFPGVPEMLESLKGRAGLVLLTSNILPNVERAMQPLDIDDIFRPKLDRVYMELVHRSKGDILRYSYGLVGDRATYIGDMESDWKAAEGSGVKFIGAAYGWGFDADETRFPVARDVPELQRMLEEKL